MKRLLAFLALCLPLYLFSQGFGSFSHDQPYFAKDAASSSPIPVVDQFFWLKPESLSGTNGENISLWIDSSGNGHHATNTFGSPLVTNNAIGTFESAYFPNNAGLTLLNSTAYTRNRTGNTFFILMRWIALEDIVFHCRQGTGGGGRLWFSHYSLTTGAIRGGRVDGTSDNSDPFELTTSKWILYSVRVNWATATVTVKTNGVLALSDTSFSTAGATSDTDSLAPNTIGANSSGANQFYGYMSEIVGYTSALSDPDIISIEQYFTNKYSLTWP